jgi:hypothetical protein
MDYSSVKKFFLWLSCLFWIGLIILSLLEMFCVPINSALDCHNYKCQVNSRFLFFQETTYFDLKDISDYKILTHGDQYIRHWNLKFTAASKSYVVGEYDSIEKTQEVMNYLIKLQDSKATNKLSINGHTEVIHIIVVIGTLLLGISALSVSLKHLLDIKKPIVK